MALSKEMHEIKDGIRAEERLAFTVVSGSMEPVIMTGDMITIEPVNLDDLRVFDIVLFWNGSDKLICHYFWHLNLLPGPDGSRIFITRPLATHTETAEDLPTPEEYLMGRITSHEIPFWTRVRIILRNRFHHSRKGILSK